MKLSKREAEELTQNTIKLGTFELQTKSFWISLVSILVLFLIAFFYINSIFWYNMNKDLNDTIKTLIQDNNEINKALIQVFNNQISSKEAK